MGVRSWKTETGIQKDEVGIWADQTSYITHPCGLLLVVEYLTLWIHKNLHLRFIVVQNMNLFDGIEQIYLIVSNNDAIIKLNLGL